MVGRVEAAGNGLNSGKHAASITGGTVVTVDSARHVFSPGAVAVSGDNIVAVDRPDAIAKTYRADQTIDASGQVVLPGLVNTHHHLPQVLTRCVPRVVCKQVPVKVCCPVPACCAPHVCRKKANVGTSLHARKAVPVVTRFRKISIPKLPRISETGMQLGSGSLHPTAYTGV